MQELPPRNMQQGDPADGACLLTMQDSSGKLAKRKYIFEWPKKGQKELEFINETPLSPL